MTETKQSIIRLLESNAHYTTEELARLAGTDAETAKNIVKELEETGAVIKYATIFDNDVIEREVVEALIEVRVTPQKNRGFDAIAEDIYSFDEVKSLYLMSGGYDLAVFVECKTLRAVSAFVSDKLSTLDTVLSTATHFILKKYKVEGAVAHENHNENKRLAIKL
ncbi:MAG: Lrp/AsnC family transcriptional regulator [Clostridia bacterium]|nr:Lrp/AsnC family transcriptional regulator [Clostridia bacterium]